MPAMRFSRPGLTEDDKRNKSITFRVSATERATFAALAKRLGLSSEAEVLRRAMDYWMKDKCP